MNVLAYMLTSSGKRHSRCLFFVTLLISFILPASAQPSQISPSTLNERIFKEGVVAYKSDQYDLAATKFEEVFASDPAFYNASVGSATFWWGRALAAQGRSDEAHRIWSAGIGALEKFGIIDPRLTSAYIESVFNDDRSTHFARAADAYLRLLERTSSYSHINETCVAIERIAQLLPLLTEKELNRVAERVHPNRCTRWRLTEEAGSFLVAWWRTQDPILSTVRNEHLEIHLKRAVSAQSRFKADRLVSQFDDRGKMYIRYGEPTQQISYGRIDQALSQRLEVVETTDSSSPPLEGSSSFGPGNPVVTLPSGMPRGELWVYDGIHASAYYFFVQEGRRYRLGQVSDLIPSHLRNFWGFRGKRRAEIAANILFGDGITTGIYERLAHVHPDFAAILTSFEMAQGGRGNFPSVWMQIRATEGEYAWARDQQMPVHHTGYNDVDSLGIDVRTARFLEQNGDTRTEVYWQADPRWVLQTSPRLHVTALQLRGDYEIREATHLAYEIDVSKEMTEPMLEPQTISLRGDSGLYHLAIQWRGATNSSRGVSTAEHDILPHRMTTMRIDSVRALTNDETVLEVSDLVVVRDLTHSTVSSSLLAHGVRRPIPSYGITAQDTVSLYFEIYHLAFGSDDRTHYSLEYEVSRLRKGGLLKLFRMEHRRTAARTMVMANSRRASERIAIPTDEWVPGKVTLTVRVTDESTGQQVERSTSLEFRTF